MSTYNAVKHQYEPPAIWQYCVNKYTRNLRNTLIALDLSKELPN